MDELTSTVHQRKAMPDPIHPTISASISSSELEAAIGALDPFDSASVKALLTRIYPFAEIVSDEGINEQCRLGQGRKLLEAFVPYMNSDAELRRLKDWIEMPISSIEKNPDLESRAWDIVYSPIYGTDEERRKLIESVKDAGLIGALAQAKLREPMTIRTKRPSWYRPFTPSSFRGTPPNLFTSFGED
jgi:hypothetical protein